MSEGLAELAVLVGSRRRAQEILLRTSLRHLAAASAEELGRFMPQGAAERFSAALRLVRAAVSPETTATIGSPHEAYAHVYPYLAGCETERMVVVACDAGGRPLATEVISVGSPTEVVVRPADLFAVPIRHRAYGFVIGHNHPSGRLAPSELDLELTERVSEGAKLLGLVFLDHLIVAGASYASLATDERLFRQFGGALAAAGR